MATETIIPATVEITTACDALDDVIPAFLAARNLIPNLHKYEANLEAVNLFNLVIRNVEGVLALARADLTLLPPANASARASFETAVKAAWMVNADDPFQREARWLAHLKEEERVYERAAKQSSDHGSDDGHFLAHAADLRHFRETVSAVLPAGISLLPGNPSMEEMLRSIGGAHFYSLYIYLSQFVHGGHTATWLYRRHLGTEKRLGEFITAENWYLPLRICWLSLSHPGNLLLSRLCAVDADYLSREQEARVVAAIEATKVINALPLH